MGPAPRIPAPTDGAQFSLRPRLPSLPELREAGLRTADPLGFVLGTKESGSRLSGEWRGARSPLLPAGLAGSAPAASPEPLSPELPIQNSAGLSPNRSIKGRQIWGDYGRQREAGGAGLEAAHRAPYYASGAPWSWGYSSQPWAMWVTVGKGRLEKGREGTGPGSHGKAEAEPGCESR